MGMKPVKKAVANVGKYTDRSGQEKNRYFTVGKLLQRDDGSHCLKLDAMPVGEFDGWINFYDLDEDRQQAPQGSGRSLDNAFDNEPVPF